MNTRTLLIFLVCVLAAAAVVFTVWRKSNVQVAPLKWSQPIPNPNGFDSCVEATEALVGKRQVSDLTPKPYKPEERLANLTAKAVVVQQNNRALSLLRTGLAVEYRQPPGHTINDIFPYYSGYRSLTWLLALEGEVKEGQDDISGALDSYLDGMQLGAVVPHGGPVIGSLVGIALQSIMRQRLWPMLNTVDAVQARKVAKRCAECSALEWEYTEIMAEEKSMFQNTLQDVLDHPDNYKNHPDMKEFASLPPSVLISMKTEHARVMDEMIVKIRKPYRPNFKVPVTEGHINRLMMSQILPTFAGGRTSFITNQTHTRLLTLAFALRAYTLEHNAYPDELQKLVPDYLPALPSDPFARKGTFQYRPQGDTYLLYSLGPDGKDDRGTAYTPTGASKLPKKNTKGDIVVGTNDL